MYKIYVDKAIISEFGLSLNIGPIINIMNAKPGVNLYSLKKLTDEQLRNLDGTMNYDTRFIFILNYRLERSSQFDLTLYVPHLFLL